VTESNALINIQANLFDAEILLIHMCNRERLNDILDSEAVDAEVVLLALLEKAKELVSSATGECSLTILARDKQAAGGDK
jgi:hypothetical protein